MDVRMRARTALSLRAPLRGNPVPLVVAALLACGSLAGGACSLAVNLDGLAASKQDGGPSEMDGPPDARTGPAASVDVASDRQAEVGGEDLRSDHPDVSPADGGAGDAPDSGALDGESDASASDTGGAGSDADHPDGTSVEADAAPSDAATGADAETGVPGDAATSDGARDAEPEVRPLACAPPTIFEATLNLAAGSPGQTACSYLPAELPRYYAAVDPGVFEGSAVCGACVIVETPAAMIEALVVDMGPGLSAGNPTAIAVNRAGMTLLAPDGSTYVTQGVDWHFVPCTLSTPAMTFKIQSGSNASYAAVLIENQRHRLTKVEYKIGTTYRNLTRSSYNYWIAAQGMGVGPFTLRMTDDLGQTVEQTGIPLSPGNVFKGQAQFPACSP